MGISKHGGLTAGIIIAILSTGCGANGGDGAADAPSPDDPATFDPGDTTLLVRGRISPHQLEIHPVFRMGDSPALPTDSNGAHRLRGLDPEGTALFDFAFDTTPLSEGDEEHFTFALPLTDREARRLQAIHLRTADGRTTERRATMTQDQIVREIERPGAITAVRDPDGSVHVTWDADRFPMAAVRDPASGQVLTFGRDGRAVVISDNARLDVVVSDGVRSARRSVSVD